MSYTKKLITTEVYYHDSNTAIEYADAIVSGKTVRYGAEVLGQLRHGDKADAIDTNGVRVVIPYDAVVLAIFTETDSEPQEKADDDFCDTGETVAERTVTLPKIAESNQTYQSDLYFFIGRMLPYMVVEGIEVKFMDNVVSSITDGQSTAEQVSWNVEDSNGTHVIAASITEDYDILGYPTVDGETVDVLSFTVGTDKRFGITQDNDEYYTEGLYSVGEVITTSSSFTKYMAQYPYDPNAEFETLPADKTLPAVEDDFKYELSRE